MVKSTQFRRLAIVTATATAIAVAIAAPAMAAQSEDSPPRDAVTVTIDDLAIVHHHGDLIVDYWIDGDDWRQLERTDAQPYLLLHRRRVDDSDFERAIALQERRQRLVVPAYGRVADQDEIDVSIQADNPDVNIPYIRLGDRQGVWLTVDILPEGAHPFTEPFERPERRVEPPEPRKDTIPPRTDRQRPPATERQRPTRQQRQRPSLRDRDRPSLHERQRPPATERQRPSLRDRDRPTRQDQQRPSRQDQQRPTHQERDTPTLRDRQRPHRGE